MKNRYLILALLILLFSSCGDYLDKQPLDRPSDGTFLSNQQEMEMALTGCYSSLYIDFAALPFPFMFDYVSDIGYERNVNDMQVLGQGAADANNKMATQLWRNFYAGIAKCNYLLQNMNRGENSVKPEDYRRIASEARFLRALFYSYLIELYGDVPLVTEVLTLSNSQRERTSKENVVNFLLQELKEAAEDLDVQLKGTSGHATKGAALALRSRVALYNERWDEAIQSAKEVMNLGFYELEAEFAKLFTYEGQDSKEVIFSIQHLTGVHNHSMYNFLGSRNAKAFTNKKPSYQMADSYECIDGLSIDKSPLYDPEKPYENRDPRLGYTIAVPGSEFLGFQFETHGDSIQCWSYRDNKRVPNLDATNPYASFTGLCWRKYANIEDAANPREGQMNLIVIRYAEVLLNYAEAKIKKGEVDQSVYDAINAVRERPSVAMPKLEGLSKEELFYAVCRERKYELASEGLRLFDIRRWKIAEKVMAMPLLGRMKKSYPKTAPVIDKYGTAHYDKSIIAGQGESSDFKMRVVDVRIFNPNRDYLWPIPYIERQTNKNLTQNPNYE